MDGQDSLMSPQRNLQSIAILSLFRGLTAVLSSYAEHGAREVSSLNLRQAVNRECRAEEQSIRAISDAAKFTLAWANIAV